MDDYAEITITKQPLTLEEIDFAPLPESEMVRLRAALQKEVEKQLFFATGLSRQYVEPSPTRCKCRGIIHRWDCHCMAS